jgi:hypothetical protein
VDQPINKVIFAGMLINAKYVEYIYMVGTTLNVKFNNNDDVMKLHKLDETTEADWEEAVTKLFNDLTTTHIPLTEKEC